MNSLTPLLNRRRDGVGMQNVSLMEAQLRPRGLLTTGLGGFFRPCKGYHFTERGCEMG